MAEPEFMWSMADCQGGNCPSLYRSTKDGTNGYIVKGWTLDASTSMRLGTADGESAVFVPADVIERIRVER